MYCIVFFGTLNNTGDILAISMDHLLLQRPQSWECPPRSGFWAFDQVSRLPNVGDVLGNCEDVDIIQGIGLEGQEVRIIILLQLT